MSELQRFLLVADTNREEALQIAGTTAQKLGNDETNLLAVVESLREYISDEDATIRGKTLSYLTAVLQALPPKFLTRQQIEVLTNFYCDRVEDGGAIAGLDTLQGLDRFNKQMAEMTARTLFQHAERLRSRSRAQKFQTLQLLNGLMLNHRAALKSMGDESLSGILEIVGDERDPRNLMLVFSILKVLMVEWDISNYVEDSFDAAYKYFPITFRPQPNDPYGITPQDLKDRLQDCISANDAFAPYSIPSLIEKLDSASFNVKRDSMNAMAACIDSYDPRTLARYSIPIWDALKFEILNAQEEVLAKESLRALKALSARLSELPIYPGKPSFLAQFTKPITKECNEQLREPQSKQAKPAREILGSVGSASAVAFKLVIQDVMAPLLTLYQDAARIAKQRELLEGLNSLLEAATTVFGVWNDRINVQVLDNPLSLFKDRLLEAFSQALRGSSKDEVSLRRTAIRGYLRLCILKDFLQNNEIGLFVQHLNEILLVELPSGDLKTETIGALAEISKHRPQLIKDVTFPAFLAALPNPDAAGNPHYVHVLECLAQISVEPAVFETLVRRLLSKLDSLLSLHSTGAPSYFIAILLTLYYAMDQKGLDNDPDLVSYYDKILRNLCRRAALVTTGDDSARNVLSNPTVLDTIGRLCNLILLHLPRPNQEEAAREVYGLYAAQGGFIPVPFAASTMPFQRRTIILSTYLLAGLPKENIQLPYTNPDMTALLDEIVQLAISEEDPSLQLSIVRHVALLVNKFLPTAGLPAVSKILTTLISPSSESGKIPPNNIRTVVWLSKALVLRLVPETTQIVTSLLDLLASPDRETSIKSARGLGLILASDDIISPKNGANIRLLAKQRVFSTIVPLISAKVREFNTTTAANATATTPVHVKQAYLTALSGILSTVPSSLVMPELPTLFPLLLQSLDLTGPDSQPIKSHTLDTLAVIIRENGVRTINTLGHVDELVNRLLKSASTSTSTTKGTSAAPVGKNTPAARAQALRCLLLLAQYPAPSDAELTASEKVQVSPLLHLKPGVLRSLMLILDDPKRDVRKAAVDARAAWLRSVEDGKDDDDD